MKEQEQWQRLNNDHNHNNKAWDSRPLTGNIDLSPKVVATKERKGMKEESQGAAKSRREESP